MLIWTRAPQTQCRTFLLLDRDGVINHDSPEYIKHWREFHFYPDTLSSLRWLREHGIEVILISNQSALNRGFMKWEDFWSLHEHMLRAIRKAGGDLLATVYCPHRPDEHCGCRKPAPGMILAAAQLFDITLPETMFIGDKSTDLLAAARAGCRGIRVERPSHEGSRPEQLDDTVPPVSHVSLAAAVSSIFADKHIDSKSLRGWDSS